MAADGTGVAMATTESGYTPCACRDCFDIAISNDIRNHELCSECADAGCEPFDGECCRDDYGVNDEDEDERA